MVKVEWLNIEILKKKSFENSHLALKVSGKSSQNKK